MSELLQGISYSPSRLAPVSAGSSPLKSLPGATLARCHGGTPRPLPILIMTLEEQDKAKT
jgi:hypothetical protein